MPRFLLLLALVLVSAGANAQLYKCKGSDGKIQFSDTACKVGSKTEIVPDRAPVTEQQRYEAQQRSLQMQNEAAALDYDKAAAQANYQAQQQQKEAQAAKQASASQAASNDTEAIQNCVRDVERRGASQNVKAEMIAACRTAGVVQRSTGISGEAVKNCVRDVERTGASEREKARQLALCHGGDVPPEPEKVLVQQKDFQHPAVIKSCTNGNCRDQFGNDYRKDVMGNLETRDGRRCRQHGATLECD